MKTGDRKPEAEDRKKGLGVRNKNLIVQDLQSGSYEYEHL